jgi:diamine N-acetyltransferase
MAREADEEQRAMPRPWAVHDAETGALVGFVMISDNIPQPMDDDLVGPYYLWKLLIDHQFQRRDYGAATLGAIVDYLATRPGADVLYTSCADGPGSPRAFYLRHGFADTGRVMWGENILALDLHCEADRGLPDHLHPRGTCADHPDLRASVAGHERNTSSPDRRECARVNRPGAKAFSGCRLQYGSTAGSSAALAPIRAAAVLAFWAVGKDLAAAARPKTGILP